MKDAVAAVILAAGSSKRMGNVNKLLALWQGKALVRHVVETAKNSIVEEVIVVTGHQSDAIELALEGLDVRFVHNPDYKEGMASSLKSGIRSVGKNQTGIAVLLADMPQLKGETLNQIVTGFLQADGRSICIPICGSRQGNPVIWPKEFFPEILTLSGDKGARELIKKYKNRVLEIPCEDHGTLIDFDTPEDIN